MSNSDKPEPVSPPPPPPPAEGPPPKAETPAAGREKPSRGGKKGSRPPADGGGRRRFRPLDVPSLEDQLRFPAGPQLKDLDAAIAGDLQEALSGFSDQELFGEEQLARPAAGSGQGGKKGKVLAIHGPDVFIDVPGGRSQGVLPITQFPDGPPALGSEVDVHIEGYDRANGLLLLSRRGAAVTADWNTVAIGMIVEARVTETNKGGLAVDVNGLRGFLPISQIDLYRVENTEQFVNQRLCCLVTEVDPAERNLVVSRRALLEKEREEAREKLWQELAEGQVRPGIVRSVRDFGAFVDLGGADGLLHVSQMSWTRVQDPTQILQPGQAVKVVVLKVDREQRKISLGLKQLTPSPWDHIEEKYQAGQLVQGKVTRLTDFGAFVELEPAVEGLIHISEIAPQRVRRVSDFLKPEQDVEVMVLHVDKDQRRIGLSLKAALPEEKPSEEGAEEPETPAPPPRPRTTPLRGGIGGDQFALPEPEE